MADLILRKIGFNDVSVLDPNISSQLAEFERSRKAIEEQEKALKEAILQEMEQKGIIKVCDEVNGLSITYVPPYDKESFDSKRFKAENPDVYDEYIKLSPVKSSIRITLK